MRTLGYGVSVDAAIAEVFARAKAELDEDAVLRRLSDELADGFETAVRNHTCGDPECPVMVTAFVLRSGLGRG